MPLELYLGWVVLWGLCPQLAMPRLPLPVCIAIMAVVDLVAMPLCGPVVRLGQHWLMGEAVAIALVLMPAPGHRPLDPDSTPTCAGRAILQIATSAQLFLLLPAGADLRPAPRPRLEPAAPAHRLARPACRRLDLSPRHPRQSAPSSSSPTAAAARRSPTTSPPAPRRQRPLPLTAPTPCSSPAPPRCSSGLYSCTAAGCSPAPSSPSVYSAGS